MSSLLMQEQEGNEEQDQDQEQEQGGRLDMQGSTDSGSHRRLIMHTLVQGHYLEMPRGQSGERTPWGSPAAKTPRCRRPQGFWPQDLPQGTPFTTLHPRPFHIMSFFGHPGLVKRDFFHCR